MIDEQWRMMKRFALFGVGLWVGWGSAALADAGEGGWAQAVIIGSVCLLLLGHALLERRQG